MMRSAGRDFPREVVMSAYRNAVVLITGCSSGIGAALAKEFAEAGHRVLATARHPESIPVKDSQVRTAPLDVTDSESISKAVLGLVEWAGRIDIVVNNAGYGLISPVSEVGLGEFRRQLETNVIGVLAVTQAVVPHMIEQGRGRLVNIGSVSGITATPFGGAYSASKAAVHKLSDAMRMELAPFGIEVVTVQPGAVDSRFGDRAAAGIDRNRESSNYREVEDFIEARARASQGGAMDTDVFASWLVGEVTRSNPPAVLRTGRHSRLLPLLARIPTPLSDLILSRKFGLGSLGRR
jgi:NAD(P)-dependent dehydrogenase (short-subunit alcohol dehydrogenase family)